VTGPTDHDSLFAQVRTSCAAVAAAATLVRINHDSIDAYAASIPVAAARAAATSDRIAASTATSDPAATIAQVLATAGVSFTSGWHDIMRKRPGMSGAVSTITRLDDYIAATGALTAARLRSITPVDASQIFEQELDGGALEDLLQLLATTLNELGELVDDNDGFVAMVENAERSADRLASLLAQMPSWNDTADYRCADGSSRQVAFYKRAQLAVASLHRTFGGVDLGAFNDLDQLTIFADNLVPHVLRIDGVLSYDTALLATIDRGELLEAGSAAEVEIRACGVHAAELIAEALRSQSVDDSGQLDIADLDHWLWSRGGGSHYKASARHRCRNPFY